MKITPTEDFLDGHDRYEEGREYEVDEDLAGRAVRNGWATSPDAPAEWSGAVAATTLPAEQVEVTLEPHDAAQTSESEV